MEFREFLIKFQQLPVLTSKVILAGESDRESMRVQLARWVNAGHLVQLKRGVYIFAVHYQKMACPPFSLAGILTAPSYVSLEKALEVHGIIPEAVFSVTSVTTKRPSSYETPLGRFEYSHVQPRLFWGYTSVRPNGQEGFLAHPEKALLDLIYLKAPKLSADYIDELRLQNLDKLNLERLLEYGRCFEKPGMLRWAEALAEYVRKEHLQEKVV